MVDMLRNYEEVARRPGRGLPDAPHGVVLTGFDAIAGVSAELVPPRAQRTLAGLGTSVQQVLSARARQAGGRATPRMTANRADRSRMRAPDDRAPEPRGR